MFSFSIALFILALAVIAGSFVTPSEFKRYARFGAAAVFFVAIGAGLLSSFATVRASHAGVVTTFGKVSPVTLPEGLNMVLPWQKVSQVYLGMDVAAALKSQAASKDLQSVHSDLTVNFHIDASKAREMYQLNPSLNYKTTFISPAIYEVFKSVIAQYAAEQIVQQRQEVSARITAELNKRLSQYYVQVQTVNLVNFGFSSSFDRAIEEKVTANQKAATAENNLKRVRFEAEQRIAQAEGEAKAIAIQSAAVEKAGGQGYVQLQAIAKWDGKLPQYMSSGAATPFVNVK